MGQIVSEADLPNLFHRILELSSGRGHPALELLRQDGSSLVIATDGPRCVLSWAKTLGGSFHSVGGSPGPVLIFDYFGSWSEAPAEFTIGPREALECARRFILSGTPDSDSVSSSQTDELHPLMPHSASWPQSGNRTCPA
jgi:hypothetical protein